MSPWVLVLHKTKMRLMDMVRPTPHITKSTAGVVKDELVGLSEVTSEVLSDDED